MAIVLGIDPGINGGIAFVSSANGVRRFISAHDIPTTGEKAKRRVDAIAFIRLMQQTPPDFAVIERAQAMPDQGSSSGFLYGRAVGALEACVAGMEIPLHIIESTAWKKAHGLIKTDKEASRQKALMLFPGAHSMLARKMDHGRAEAVLIANYGLMTFTGTT